jgi:hypothetical protein
MQHGPFDGTMRKRRVTISVKLSISSMSRLQIPHKSVRCCQDSPHFEVSVVEPVPCTYGLATSRISNNLIDSMLPGL